MLDPIAILRAHAADLRDMAMTMERAIDDIARKSANGDQLSLIGIGMTDKVLAPIQSVTIQGGDIDVDGDGFTPMRPNDGDPETGQWP